MPQQSFVSSLLSSHMPFENDLTQPMASLSCCPACNANLALFAPREATHHVNACLDAQAQEPESPATLPRCPICNRDLTELTISARAEHENRCVDNLNPPPKGKRRRARSTLVPKRPRSPPKSISADTRVKRFLHLLGLDRYTARFAEEEIDFPALRLLEDSDFASLRIPDNARRRIADALTAVPILAQIEEAQVHEPVPESAIVPTQRFGTSRLANHLRRNKPMIQLDDSDGEYAPTQTVDNSPARTKPAADTTPGTQRTDEVRQTAACEDVYDESDGESRDYFEEIERAVKSGLEAPASESSDVSSLASSVDLDELLRSTSQITTELKLQKWRRKQIRKEKSRHDRELERIEEEYCRLLKDAKYGGKHLDDQARTSPEVPKFVEENCDTIDLTQEVADDVNCDRVENTSAVEKSIVISSNESDPRKLSIRGVEYRSSQHDKVDEVHAEEELNAEGRTPRKDSSEGLHGETWTPDQGEKNSSRSGEVINLISSEKKRQTKEPLSPAPIESRGNIEPLLAPTPNGNAVSGNRYSCDDSDEDFMDLLGIEKENTEDFSQPSCHTEDNQKRTSTDCDSGSMEEAPSQSRFKKRQKKAKVVKANPKDIAELIRNDKILHEDILLMESIPFERILSRLQGGQKQVTKKGLNSFLQNEGILFRGEVVEAGSQQHSYLCHLNSDRCAD